MNSAEVLARDGPVAALLPGFVERKQQMDMSAAVEAALSGASSLMIEAGTGTGKSLAYLIPIITSGLKVIVSTGTKNLQDQLFYKDLPLIREALGVSFKATVLKGRANYLCPHRLHSSMNTELASSQDREDLLKVRFWSSQTTTGDISEITDVAEDAGIWPSVTSTVDNCLGNQCSYIDVCPLYRARSKAAEADLIIVNHHLLFADLSLKEDSLGEILPEVNGVLLDEAHQVPDIAGLFFGVSLSSGQISELAKDVLREQDLLGRDDPRVVDHAERLGRLVRDLRPQFNDRILWSEFVSMDGMRLKLAEIDEELAAIVDVLSSVRGRSAGLESCYRRCSELSDKFAMLTESIDPGTDYLHWVEVRERSIVIRLSPLRLASHLNALMNEVSDSWIFTSGTLTINNSFEHFRESMGIGPDIECIRYESPFDYQRQVMCYLPEHMPDPSDPNFHQTLLERTLPIIRSNPGRTFFLCTSHRAVQEIGRGLARDSELVCFIQGSRPKSALLDRFRETEHAVLVATTSFWEGVDVKGSDLTCVIIDKLPFMNPSDPLVRARSEVYDMDGRSGFSDYILPNAVTALRQGFGRLIRDENDRGLFMLGDPRVLTRTYGALFLNSLPDMTTTRDECEACEFLLGL